VGAELNGRASGSGGPRRAGLSDRRQLEQSPLDLRRVLRLFADHKTSLAAVVAAIVVTSIAGTFQPFLIRAVVDDALPQQNVRLLLWCVGGMLGIAAVTQVVGVFQT